METMPIDKLRMQFTDELEQAFQEESFDKSLNHLRISIAVVAVIYALFGILDGLVTPEVKFQAWFIRYAIVIPTAIFVLSFSFSPQFKKYHQILISFLVFVGGGGIVALIVITQISGRYFHFAGLLLVFMTSYTSFKLRFLHATVVCWTIIGLYEISAIWISHAALPVLLTDNFFYISANLMGMFTSYQRELYQRKDFFRNRLMHNMEREKHNLEKDQMHLTVEKAIASFRESEEKFRTLAETAAMAIFIHQGGNFLYANRAAEVIGGYTVDEYLTMHFMSLVHPDFIELVKTRARERLTGNSEVPAQYEFKLVRKNGEERWVLMTGGISEFEGKPAVIGTLIDITGRKRAEAERDKMALLIENSSDFIGMTDMDGKVIFVNSAGRKLVGLDSEDDVRTTVSDDYFMPEDLREHREHKRNGTWRGEFRLKHFKTGAPIPVDMYSFDVNDETSKKPVARAAVMRDIADLKRAREEREHYYQQLQQALQSLKESETRFRTLAETTTASIIIHRGGKFLYANPAVQKITGYTLDDFLHMEFWEIVHPEYRDLVRERGRTRISGAEVPREYEFKVLTKTGEERWAVTSSGIIDYEGQPAVIGTLFDITDRKRAEEEGERLNRRLQQTLHSLEESEAKFRSLAETAPAAIFIHQGSKFLYANPSSLSMSGFTRTEFLTMDFWTVAHPEDRDMIMERGRAHLRGDKTFTRYEYRIVTKSCEVRWVDMTVALIEFEGKPAVIGNVFDITDRKRAEEERERLNRQLQQALRSFQESEAKFRILAETTTAAIFIHRGGKLFYANPAGEAIAGYTNEEFLSMDFWTIIHPDYKDLVMERGKARLRGERIPPEYEFKIVTKNGKERWVSMTAGTINYEGEQAVIGTLFDITDRKRAEEEQLNLYEQRIAVEKRHLLEKEEILMDLHDGIGGITTNISMLSELGQKAADMESVKKTLVTISRLSREGITEIRSFMQSLDSRELSWHTMAAELRNQGTKMVDPHKITLTVETSMDDGQDQPGSLLWINLIKIYKEALTNIVKHSQARSVAVTLKVADQELQLTIQDDGIGCNSNQSRTGGRGLANMKRRAERLGGNMSINSNHGTTVIFTLHLPIKYPMQGIVS